MASPFPFVLQSLSTDPRKIDSLSIFDCRIKENHVEYGPHCTKPDAPGNGLFDR
jgi:hypothetical protein